MIHKKLQQLSAHEFSQIQKLQHHLNTLSEKYELKPRDFAQLLKKRSQQLFLPASIFNSTLRPLESVVLYLHYYHDLSQTAIAKQLNRDHTTIWTTLNRATKKVNRAQYLAQLKRADLTYTIPLSSCADRALSILESVCLHLKNTYQLSYHQIAQILGKNDRTIWTVVNRALKK